jgi:nucleotide-binding universal stress UspA family protein
MTDNTLLLAIDQFAPGQAAVDFTIGFATRSHAAVCVFHVREQHRSLRVPPLESAEEAGQLIDRAVCAIEQAGVPAEGRVRLGRDDHVGDFIVEEASAAGCNAIVLGSLRLRGPRRIAGHGVRECVVRTTPLPVIITPTALSCRRLDPTTLAP